MKNTTIHNQLTGQTIEFVKTGKETEGKLLEMIATYRPGSSEPKAHYHPRQKECFTVLSGALTIRRNDHLLQLREGDQVYIQPGQVHGMWNNSDEDTVVRWKVWPAMDTEDLLRTLTGLSNDGKTNKQGIPGLLQLSLTASRFSAAIRLSTPPFFILKLLFAVLRPVARLRGYKATYEKYL